MYEKSLYINNVIRILNNNIKGYKIYNTKM